MLLRFKAPRRHRVLGLLGVLVLGGALAGVAWASIPGPDGTITACAAKNGTIRLIDTAVTTGKACKKGEIVLTWNQSGQQGLPGDPGQPGPTAGYTQFQSGEGGAGGLQLPEDPQEPVRVLTLNVPSDWVAAPNEPGDEPIYRDGITGVVATVSVLLWNRGPTMAHPGCTVLSDQGGFGDGHMYLSGMDSNGVSPNTSYLTFQATSPAGPPSEIYLTCSVAEDHPPLPPNTSMDVEVLAAQMSVVPRGF